jgi:predicted metal-binding transcription factor (methanogenesis marker protein 9)
MKANNSTILIDNYFGLLRSLSKENKLRLIDKLSKSIVDEAAKDENLADKFFGAFKSEKSAEDIITEIRNSRTFTRTIEAF